MTVNSLIKTEAEFRKNLKQRALDAIHAGMPEEAHQILLSSLGNERQDIETWLLLGSTAPNQERAAFFYRNLQEEYPNNPLGQELGGWIVQREGMEEGENKKFTLENISADPKANGAIEGQTVSQPPEQDIKEAFNRQTTSVKEEKYVQQADNQSIDRNGHQVKRRKIAANIWVPLAYLGALTLAEIVTTFANPQVGMILHGVILVALILHAALFAHHGLQKFLITMTLAPLIRVMSLSLPLLQFPMIYWYAMIGAPLLLAAFLVLKVTGFEADRIGLNLKGLPWQLTIALTGVLFGFMEYIILRPSPLEKALSWQQIFVPALILLIFTGFLEEFIFRGLIQRGAYGTVGRYGMLYVAVLFAVLHIGYRSLWDVAFVFAVGLFFSLVVLRTGSLVGVTLSHGLTNIALYLVIPFIMNATANPVATKPAAIDTSSPPAFATMIDCDMYQVTYPVVIASQIISSDCPWRIAGDSGSGELKEAHQIVSENWLLCDENISDFPNTSRAIPTNKLTIEGIHIVGWD